MNGVFNDIDNIFIIGDIEGKISLFNSIYKSFTSHTIKNNTLIVFLGDLVNYKLVNYDSIFDKFNSLQQKINNNDKNVHCVLILGNHDILPLLSKKFKNIQWYINIVVNDYLFFGHSFFINKELDYFYDCFIKKPDKYIKDCDDYELLQFIDYFDHLYKLKGFNKYMKLISLFNDYKYVIIRQQQFRNVIYSHCSGSEYCPDYSKYFTKHYPYKKYSFSCTDKNNCIRDALNNFFNFKSSKNNLTFFCAHNPGYYYQYVILNDTDGNNLIIDCDVNSYDHKYYNLLLISTDDYKNYLISKINI